MALAPTTSHASATSTSDYTVVRKAADESVAASTVLQADDELFFTAAAAGTYEIDLVIIYGSPLSGGTPDMKHAFGEDATNRGYGGYVGPSTADTPGNVVVNFGNTSSLAVGTAVANRMIKIVGVYVGNGGTAGFYWAQNTSDANPTIVRAGSVLRYRLLS